MSQQDSGCWAPGGCCGTWVYEWGTALLCPSGSMGWGGSWGAFRHQTCCGVLFQLCLYLCYPLGVSITP